MLLIFLFLVLILGSSFVKLISALFSGKAYRQTQPQSSQRRNSQTHTRNGNHQSSSDKKIIAKDEGEYVEFEEIKEN